VVGSAFPVNTRNKHNKRNKIDFFIAFFTTYNHKKLYCYCNTAQMNTQYVYEEEDPNAYTQEHPPLSSDESRLINFNVLMDAKHSISLDIPNMLSQPYSNHSPSLCADYDLPTRTRSILVVRRDTRVNPYYIQDLRQKIIHIAVLIIFAVPFPICDLHFAYADNTCVHDLIRVNHVTYPFNAKTYLLLCGYSVIVAFALKMFVALSASNRLQTCFTNAYNRSDPVMRLVGILIQIYGGALYWSVIFPNEDCDHTVYQYLGVSIHIKIIANIIVNTIHLYEKYKSPYVLPRLTESLV